MDRRTQDQLVACWREVTNAGGAVGFPFPPVDAEHVRPALEAMLEGLAPTGDRLLLASVDHGRLAGWLLLSLNAAAVTRHWAHVSRVQTTLQHRGRGVGRALMEEVARSAYEDLGLDQLHLELRAGPDLEGFYGRLGWEQVGRWPAALRLSEDDHRDEVLMLLSL